MTPAMRFAGLAFLGAISALLATAGCGSGQTQSPGGEGGGGSGGATTSSTATFSTTTTPSTTTSSTGSGGDKGMPSDVYPAPHADPPTVVNYGGPVLASPRFVQVFFSNDDPEAVSKLKGFGQQIGSSQYWAATTAEYGVGPGTAEPAIDLPEVAPEETSDVAIKKWLGDKLNNDDPAWPAADENTLYILHYPFGTLVKLQGQESCVSFGGYHSNIVLNAAHQGRYVAYAVIPNCGDFGGVSGVDSLTAVESHELVEAATDPYPQSDPAHAFVDDANAYWGLALGGGENADMCAQDPASFTIFDEMPFYVQRSWSNVAAKAGHDPCVPTHPGEVYFNAAPDLPDDIEVQFGPDKITMKGVKIPVGESRTIPVRLFSDGPTDGPWDVEVQDATQVFGPLGFLDLSLDRYSGENGEKLYLTITPIEESAPGIEVFRIVSHWSGLRHEWYGVVGH